MDNKPEAPAIDYKNIPMIKFLREKGEKKIAEKRFLRRTQAAAGVGPSTSKGSKTGQSKVEKEREREKGGGTSNAKGSSGFGASGTALSVLKVFHLSVCCLTLTCPVCVTLWLF